MNDDQVRAALNVSSVSTVLRMRRLKYLAPLLSSDAHMLHSLLACRGTCHDAPVMPWCRLVCDDLKVMAAQLHHRLGNLGDPLENASEWSRLMVDFPHEWKSLVECLHDPPSCSSSGDPRPACDLRFVCSLCESNGRRAAFATSKALQSHARVKHGSRSFVKQFIGSDYRCPVCHNQFSTRLRAIAHLSETRKRGNRTRLCNDVIMHGCVAPLDPATIAELDSIDRKLRRDARLKGKSQPLASYKTKRLLVDLEQVQGPPKKRIRLRTKTCVQ